MENKITMEELTNYCKNYGYIFQGSEIYGGLANTWDFGPLGVELKNNIKKAWTKKFIQEDINNVGLDSAILMNPKTWEASGHLKTFSDPLIDCKHCKTRHRADKLLEDLGIEEKIMLNVLTVVVKTLLTLETLILCLRHFKELQKTLKVQYI